MLILYFIHGITGIKEKLHYCTSELEEGLEGNK